MYADFMLVIFEKKLFKTEPKNGRMPEDENFLFFILISWKMSPKSVEGR